MACEAHAGTCFVPSATTTRCTPRPPRRWAGSASTGWPNVLWRELSYGEKRRLEIALALAQNPRLLLLDEPLAGLSTEERETVRRVIADIPRSTTVVLIEHDMDIALDLADTVTLLQFGAVIVDGSRDEVIADPRTREVYLGH